MKKEILSTVIFSFLLLNTFAQDAFREIMSIREISHKGENRGVAFGDYDNDGDEDLYISIVNGPNQLYQNLGNDQFVDVAQAAGVAFGSGSRSSVWGDLDNDGWLDLYVSNNEKNDALYLNNGDGTFTDITLDAGVINVGVRPLSVNMCDVDLDGFLDIYIANFRSENVLYHNNGDLTFSNYVYPSNTRDDSHSMGAVFFDYDNDGDSDLYLTHDGGVPNIMYENNGKGNFTDVSEATGLNYAGLGMGTDFGDVNNDGFFDVYVTNLYENVLYVNDGDGTFTDIARSAGVDDYGMGWSTNFVDFDNDGWLDIYVANDSHFSPYPNVLYRNLGDSTFENMTHSMVAAMGGTYGSAFGDWNNDGWLDLAIANSGRDDINRLFQNLGNDNDWIGFHLEGTESNRSAIGARVTIEDDSGLRQMDEVTSGSGFAAQNSLRLHFGTGASQSVSSATVRWPSGLQQEFANLETGAYYKIVEGGEPERIAGTVTSADGVAFASHFDLEVFPNPVSDAMQVRFHLRQAADANLTVFNALGQPVQVLARGQYAQGAHQLTWHIRENVQPGIYLVKLSTDNQFFTKKVIVR
jgi:hypothetical protein